MNNNKQITHIIVIIICLILWDGFGLVGVQSQEETPTPVHLEKQHESLFPDDTCISPCWFSLIPGESHAEDVVDFFAIYEQANFVAAYENEELIQIQHGSIPVIEDGFYNFDFGPAQIYQCCGIYSRINIREGKVYDMRIITLQIITFDEAIERLGMPDTIYMGRYDTYSASDYSPFFFSFIYFDVRIRVGFITAFDLDAPLECDHESLANNLRAGGAGYYSPQAANEILKLSIGGKTVSQPALFAYNQEERYFPEELWEMILKAAPSTSILCEDLWDTLPEERILPDIRDKAEKFRYDQ